MPNQTCQVGLEGDPCVVSGGDCNPDLAPFCGPDGMCHDGDTGDPCFAGGCMAGAMCTDGLCP